MKILFVTPLDPYECYSGGGVRTRILWNALRKVGDVYTTVLLAWGERMCSQKPVESDKIKYARDFNACNYKARFRQMVFRGFMGRNLDENFLDKDELLSRLGWSGTEFDLVVTRFAWMNTRIAAWKIAPVVLDIDDLPTEDFATLHRKNMPFLNGLRESFIVRWWQNFSFRMAKGAWLPNQFQMPVVERFCPCVYLPNVVRAVDDNYDSGIVRRKRLMSVGSLDYKANREGIDWFVRNVWPEFHKIHPNYEYVVAGHGLPEALNKEWSAVEGLNVLGFVKDLDLAYAECEAVVAPVFIGGGTAVKVIEAIAHGRKVFATRFALRGLTKAQISQAGVVEFSTAQDFTIAFEKWCARPEHGQGLEKEGMRRMIEENYSVPFFEAQVRHLIEGVLKH